MMLAQPMGLAGGGLCQLGDGTAKACLGSLALGEGGGVSGKVGGVGSVVQRWGPVAFAAGGPASPELSDPGLALHRRVPGTPGRGLKTGVLRGLRHRRPGRLATARRGGLVSQERLEMVEAGKKPLVALLYGDGDGGH